MMHRSGKRRRRIGVDLDGTAAHYEGWRGVEHIGEPVPAVLARIKRALAAGIDVWIFTARAAPHYDDGNLFIGAMDAFAIDFIREWCLRHVGVELPVTCVKMREFDEIWDDKTVGVRSNMGDDRGAERGSMWNLLATDAPLTIIHAATEG